MDLSNINARVLVEDFGACFDFYTRKLGLQVHWGDRNGPFASFQVEGSDIPCFAMFLAKDMSRYRGYQVPEGTGIRDRTVYVIPTDDADRDYNMLRERGVEFLGEPQTIREWYMRCAYFRDPEGNLFELCQDEVDFEEYGE